MPSINAFGKQFGRALGIDDAPSFVTRGLRKTEIVVTEIRSDSPPLMMSDDVPRQDAYMVGLQLRAYTKHEHAEDGRVIARNTYRGGETCFYDLRRGHAFMMVGPFHSIHFLLTRRALNALADDAHARWSGELDHRAGVSVPDATVRRLGETILLAFSRPEQASRIFLDHVTLALAAHMVESYGGVRRVTGPPRGGLAAWQERRAREILDANRVGELPLAELARECGLSTSHFTRAFRQSFGMRLIGGCSSLRVGRAKELMLGTNASLAEIALSSGFSDQSHFTRVFARIAGASPGAWRRSNRE